MRNIYYRGSLAGVAIILSGSSLGQDACFTFEAADPNDPFDGWEIFHAPSSSVTWTSSTDPACFGGTLDNLAGGVGDFACVDSSLALPDELVDTYLCSPQIAYSELTARELRFSYTFTSNETDNDFEVLEGPLAPTLATLGSYDILFSNAADASREIVSVPLSEEFTTAHVCFRYRAINGFGAFIDNVEFSPPSCPASDIDSDNDGVADDTDNCTAVANSTQQDTDQDSFGNMCDTDLNGDCVSNAVDLGIFRTQFFLGGDFAADFNGNGTVDIVDLGILRLRFFTSPGPSALASCAAEPQ